MCIDKWSEFDDNAVTTRQQRLFHDDTTTTTVVNIMQFDRITAQSAPQRNYVLSFWMRIQQYG